jgi:hypothetical protein
MDVNLLLGYVDQELQEKQGRKQKMKRHQYLQSPFAVAV